MEIKCSVKDITKRAFGNDIKNGVITMDKGNDEQIG